ncbi:NADH-quinone oxidoreductase subunit L [Thalassotalea sp. HSM 43]|nr:NADH-quinone oxidoreductase subunit L [Thalassotalea sp. HSM 43]
MNDQQLLLAWLPFFPLLSFLLLVTVGHKLNWFANTVLSVGAVLLSAASALYLQFTVFSDASATINVELWRWFMIGTSEVNIAFKLDSLSMVMTLVVSNIGFLIHTYASAYMKSDAHYHRFMAYMNLFIVAMLILVLADNLVLLYLGWEGVGLCSFLLIGFWYQDANNAAAAKKAFIITRVGDTFLAIGLFMLFKHTGSLQIDEISEFAQLNNFVDGDVVFIIAMLLLGGAVGKSAQLPLQTWLPDAMAGPTPVSALIHAATMVTAGVYLIARMQAVFVLSPDAMMIVSWIGGLTLLLAGLCALAQSDIKRVLAYSTMSQIGYMMLALGAGAFAQGIDHLMTHAFFKALLFLTAGSIILALHHEQNIFKMGGLLKRLPMISALFFVGIAALLALPLTSGFVSKEAIINQLYLSPTAGPMFWWMAVIGALLTSIYSFRLVFITFFGRYRGHAEVESKRPVLEYLPLILLAILSIVGGLLLADLSFVLPDVVSNGQSEPGFTHILALSTPYLGALIAYVVYFPKASKQTADNAAGNAIEPQSRAYQFWQDGGGFDLVYKYLLIKPFAFLAHINRRDVIDKIVLLIEFNASAWSEMLRASQNGLLRFYAAMLVLGCVVVLAFVMAVMGASA